MPSRLGVRISGQRRVASVVLVDPCVNMIASIERPSRPWPSRPSATPEGERKAWLGLTTRASDVLARFFTDAFMRFTED